MMSLRPLIDRILVLRIEGNTKTKGGIVIMDMPFIDSSFHKDKFGVEGKKVLLTFGLLSPNKGIETVLQALPIVVEKFPDVVYLQAQNISAQVQGNESR